MLIFQPKEFQDTIIVKDVFIILTIVKQVFYALSVENYTVKPKFSSPVAIEDILYKIPKPLRALVFLCASSIISMAN